MPGQNQRAADAEAAMSRLKSSLPPPPVARQSLLVPIKPGRSFCKKVVPEWKLLVGGGRDFADAVRLESVLDRLTTCLRHVAVVVGDCPTGADRLAREWARTRWHTAFVFQADWDKHGKGAGPARNREMAEACCRAVFFWDGDSRGTADCIAQVRRLNKPARVYRY